MPGGNPEYPGHRRRGRKGAALSRIIKSAKRTKAHESGKRRAQPGKGRKTMKVKWFRKWRSAKAISAGQGQERRNIPWFLGLDIGTGVIGWAVTDSVLCPVFRYNEEEGVKKALWGTRVIEGGTADREDRDFGPAGKFFLCQISEIIRELESILGNGPKKIFLGGDREITGAAADILKNDFPETEIIPAGEEGGRFGECFRFLKIEGNDFRRGKKALLHILAGRGEKTVKMTGDKFVEEIQRLGREEELITRCTPGQQDCSSPEFTEEYRKRHPEAAAYFLYVRAVPKSEWDDSEYMLIPVPFSLAAKIRTGKETGSSGERQGAQDSVRKDLQAYCFEVWEKEGKEYAGADILEENIPCNALLELGRTRIYISPGSGAQQALIDAVTHRLRELRRNGAECITSALESAKEAGEKLSPEYDSAVCSRRKQKLNPVLRDCGDDVLPAEEKELLLKGYRMAGLIDGIESLELSIGMMRLQKFAAALLEMQQFCSQLPKKGMEQGVIRLPCQEKEEPKMRSLLSLLKESDGPVDRIFSLSVTGFYEKNIFPRVSDTPERSLYGSRTERTSEKIKSAAASGKALR